MKAILGFTRMSVRGINKAKRELGFVLMALNIRKVTAQRAENNQKNYKKDNFYIISIEIVFFHLSRYFMSRTLLFIQTIMKENNHYSFKIRKRTNIAYVKQLFIR